MLYSEVHISGGIQTINNKVPERISNQISLEPMIKRSLSVALTHFPNICRLLSYLPSVSGGRPAESLDGNDPVAVESLTVRIFSLALLSRPGGGVSIRSRRPDRPVGTGQLRPDGVDGLILVS